MSEAAGVLTAVKGMQDILPEQIVLWQQIESVIRKLTANYAYQEIRTPLLERTQLFKRSIGEVTDIVEKEMFSFPDQNGDSLTLRPEGTASCVRAGMEHALFRNQQAHKLWYCGPMFRYERPQKGRYRQFNQLGVEAFNFVGPEIDAEQLAMTAKLWKELKIDHLIRLEINSLGDLECRNRYKEELVAYFKANINALDEDSKRRLTSNPLRILDSKNPEMQNLIAGAPTLLDYIDQPSGNDFNQLQEYLSALNIPFTINPRIVRGLDYYNGLVYEWVTDSLGSQSAVCAGGRYDNLVSMLGGAPTPAVGFAMGIERIVLLLETLGQERKSSVDGFLICVGASAEQQRLALAERIRESLPQFNLATGLGGGSFNNLFKKADKSGANVALIIGDDEIAKGMVSIKYLRDNQPQQTVLLEQIASILGVK